MTSKTTFEKIGNKKVNIRTFGSERMRISVLLCMEADGKKLPNFLVFKDEIEK